MRRAIAAARHLAVAPSAPKSDRGYIKGIMTAESDKIYGAGELAKFFGVTVKTIWEWCKKGKLPAFKIGKEWKVRVSDLNKTISQKVNVQKDDKGARLF